MRARGYIRESTERQGERFGPDAQRAAIRRACAELGLDLDEGRWYVDLVSGTGKVVRDELAQALADATEGSYTVLVCYDTSRFARNERDAFSFEERFHRAGARVYFTLERIWADDEDQAMPKGIFHVINAEYSRKLSRRIRDALASKRIRGGHIGGIPWGYRLSADKMRLEPSDDHPVRLLAWELYAGGGLTTASLAAELNGRGHRITWKGRTRPFTKWTLTEIFRSRVDLEVGGLDPRIHERVMELLDRRRIARDKVGQRRHRYLFASVARCAECGEGYWGRLSHRKDRPRPYAQIRHAPRGCGSGSRNEERLAEEFGRWLSTWRLGPAERVKLARYLAQPRGETDLARERREQLTAERERVRKLYQWGDMGDEEYARERTRIQRALDALAPRSAPAPSEDALRLASQIGTAWGLVSEETRQRFVDEWVQELRIHKNGSVDVVPRESYRLIVCASVGREGPGAMPAAVSMAGTSPALPTVPTFWAA